MRKLFTLKSLLLFPIIFFASFLPNIGIAQIAAWNTFGQTAWGTQGLAPITKDANISVIGLTRGSGVTTSGTAAGNVWGGTGWSAASSADAISNNKFITLSIVPNAGYSISLSTISPFIIRASSTAPINFLIQYQINSNAFVDITTRSITRPSSTSNFTLVPVDLSGISDLQNIPSTSSVTFRIVPYMSTSTSGALYIGNQSNVTSFAINGSVTTACTNPTVYNITGGGSYCSGGTAPSIGLDNSESGVSYQLKKDGSNVGSPIPGTTGTPINFGVQSAAGTYTVTGIKGACSSTMNGTTTVSIVSCGTPSLTATSLADFGNVCINTTASPNSFSLDGSNLSANGTINLAALPGFTYSENANGTYSDALNFSYTGNNFSGKTIYVKFTPTFVQSYDGNISISGGGVENYNIPVTGSGVNNSATAATTGSSNVTATTATVSGALNRGCTSITGYGFEYSTATGFTPGSGTTVNATNLSGGIFSANITGLVPNQQYFYKAFVISNGVTVYGSQLSFINSPLPVPMASQPGLTYTEDFHDIANWTNFFILGEGANHFDGLSANATGTIPDGVKITTSTNSFVPPFGNPPAPSASGGVHKGTDQLPSTQSIVLLSTGSGDNSTSAAIDFYLDFTGVNAGTLSFNWASLNNQTGDRKSSLRIYGSINGTTFTEITSAAVLNFTNNNPTSGSVVNVQLPEIFNNSATARLRFYYSNGSGGTTGSRPKISIDNLMVTAVPSTPCVAPTVQPTSMLFGAITDVSIQGTFTAAIPASDQYITVASTNSSLTSNLVDGTTYNVGDAFGDGTVVAKGSSVNFTATDLSPATTYYFFTFAVNAVCTGGPKYLNTDPLISTATTNSPLPSCVAPSSQATNLIFDNVSINSIHGSFTATTADEYLVLVSTSSSLSNSPVSGTSYNTGDVIGNATVVQESAATSFTATGLAPETQYYFFVISLNSQNCIKGPNYNNSNTLTGAKATQSLPPCVNPTSQPTLLTFNTAGTSISGTFNSSNSADAYLIIRSTSSSLSAAPTDNTNYSIASSFGGGTVISNSAATSFLTTNLTSATTYYFFVFAANKNCSGGTKYLADAPLTGSATTTSYVQNNYYFGTLHSHSDYSDGNQDHPGYTPADDYKYAMTAQCMDFLGISEHNHFSSANSPGNTITNFHKGFIQADTFTTAHPNFLALYGMEWGVISGGGHVVVYGNGMDQLFGWESGNGAWGPSDNYDVFVAKSDYTGPAGLFKTINDYLGDNKNTFATLAHPNQTDYNNLAGSAYNVVADNAIVGTAVESGPATTTTTNYTSPGTSMSYLWYYQLMLSKGYHLGPSIDHDNHNTTFGHTAFSRTAVIAPALTKSDLVQAMRDMHFYATQDCDSKVDFTVNTKMMGSVITGRNAPAISVTLSDLTNSTTNAVIRVMYGKPGSGVMAVKIDSAIGNTLYFVDNNLENGATGYYYIDIANGTSRIVTSPIWYTRTCSVESNANVYSCGSYEWNGQTYTESGTYSKAGLRSIGGCDSTAVLHLTITTPTTGDTTAVACDSFTWYGTTYTESGTATKVLKERGGCDSTVTLHLTINHSTTHTTTETACDSYTWAAPLGDGLTYTTSGTYTHVSKNASGCDHTETLILTIRYSTSHTTTETACGSYTWSGLLGNGQTYTASGTFTNVTTNEAGCVHTETLNLTINPKPSVTVNTTQVLPFGVNPNTVYIGYAPASVLIVNATASGGTGSYTFSWSAGTGLVIVNGTSGSSVQVYATGSGNYSSTVSVTVFDSKGCSETVTVPVYVIDLRSGNKNDKVTVCHNGTSLSVDGSAIQAHLKHGDQLGVCPSVVFSARTSATSSTIKNVDIEPGSFSVTVSPNPTNTNFKIKVNSISEQLITIKVSDAAGRVLTALNSVQNNSLVTFGGTFRSGTYFAEVTQGIHRKTIKLVKLN